MFLFNHKAARNTFSAAPVKPRFGYFSDLKLVAIRGDCLHVYLKLKFPQDNNAACVVSGHEDICGSAFMNKKLVFIHMVLF